MKLEEIAGEIIREDAIKRKTRWKILRKLDVIVRFAQHVLEDYDFTARVYKHEENPRLEIIVDFDSAVAVEREEARKRAAAAARPVIVEEESEEDVEVELLPRLDLFEEKRGRRR